MEVENVRDGDSEGIQLLKLKRPDLFFTDRALEMTAAHLMAKRLVEP